MEKKCYVIDTNGIISFYSQVFKRIPGVDRIPVISQKTRQLIEHALSSSEGEVLLSVPTIVFIEIFEKYLRRQGEFYREFFYEVFVPLKQSPNVELRAIDQEVLENLLTVDGILANHDLHDKIVVASALTLECNIITFDDKIIEFVRSRNCKIGKVVN